MPFLRVVGEPAPAGVPLGRFELAGDRVLIGRSVEADLRLPDERVSRLHVLLERDGAGWCACDRGSANGTLIDGRPLSRTVRLRTGMTLQIAGYRLRYDDESADPAGETVEAGPQPKPLSAQEHLAVCWLCEPARARRGEFVEPASVRDICAAMHLAKSTVEKLLNNAQRKLVGAEQPLDRALLASLARSRGIVTDDDLDALPARADPTTSGR